jgi:2,4-diaminopentanoate dehydrogenase
MEPLRIVTWSTGTVGRKAISGVLARPDMELVGGWVSSEAKDGRDLGELAGLDPIGIAATRDEQELLSMKPDCVVYTAMADDRLVEAIDDLCRILRAGVNVVSSSPVFLQFPGGLPKELTEPVEQAARDGGASLFVNGVDPGWANDLLPLAVSTICERIDELRCQEVVNYATYDNPKVLFDIMGFGTPMDHTPMLLQPGILSLAWGQVVRQLAVGLGVDLDDIELHEQYEDLPAHTDFDIASGPIKEGTRAAIRFEVQARVNGVPRVVLEHVTRLHDDLAPDWPQPTGQGGYRVIATGSPSYTVDMQMMGEDGDHNTAGIQATAMRLVTAIPSVVAAEPGIVTALDLPLTWGRGLLNTAPA